MTPKSVKTFRNILEHQKSILEYYVLLILNIFENFKIFFSKRIEIFEDGRKFSFCLL